MFCTLSQEITMQLISPEKYLWKDKTGFKQSGINLIFFKVILSLVMYLYYSEAYLPFQHLRQMSHTPHPD